MAKTANLYARIEPSVKEQAETILSALGIPASNAINMFYKQIILQKGLPFDLKIPAQSLPEVTRLTNEQMNIELEKGFSELSKGKTKSAQSAFSDIRKDYER